MVEEEEEEEEEEVSRCGFHSSLHLGRSIFRSLDAPSVGPFVLHVKSQSLMKWHENDEIV